MKRSALFFENKVIKLRENKSQIGKYFLSESALFYEEYELNSLCKKAGLFKRRFSTRLEWISSRRAVHAACNVAAEVQMHCGFFNDGITIYGCIDGFNLHL